MSGVLKRSRSADNLVERRSHAPKKDKEQATNDDEDIKPHIGDTAAPELQPQPRADQAEQQPQPNGSRPETQRQPNSSETSASNGLSAGVAEATPQPVEHGGQLGVENPPAFKRIARRTDAVPKPPPIVHRHGCNCRCGRPIMLDFPDIIENILMKVDFRTLLKFRGTSKAFRDKIDKALDHLVVVELPGPPPHCEPTIHITTKTGYRVLDAPSSMCLGQLEDTRKHRPTHIHKTANGIANYLYQKSCGRRDKEKHEERVEPLSLVVDIIGHVQSNFGNAPHLLQDFLSEVLFIKEMRHLSTDTSHPSLVFSDDAHNIVILNDWASAPRTVQLRFMTKSCRPKVTYRFTGCDEVTEGQLVNTVVKDAMRIVYDFTESSATSGNQEASVNNGSDTRNTTVKSGSGSSTSPLLHPIHSLVRHAALHLAQPSTTLVVVGWPCSSWFDPPCPLTGGPKIKNSAMLPMSYLWFRHLLSREMDRNGCEVPSDDRIKFIHVGVSSLYKYYLPNSYTTLESMNPDRPMIISADVVVGTE